MSKDHFRRGRAALNGKSYALAHGAFDMACKEAPDNVELEAWRAYARYLDTAHGAPSAAANDPWIAGVTKKNCKLAVSKAVATNKSFAAGHMFLGHIALEEGLASEAIKHLERAITLDPDLSQAKTLLSNAQSRRPKSSRRPKTFGEKVGGWLSGLRN